MPEKQDGQGLTMTSKANTDQAGASGQKAIAALLPDIVLTAQNTQDQIETLWLSADHLLSVAEVLRFGVKCQFECLYDLSAIDERDREHRAGQPDSDFTLVYLLRSYAANRDLRLKVPLNQSELSAPSLTNIWPNADWY